MIWPAVVQREWAPQRHRSIPPLRHSLSSGTASPQRSSSFEIRALWSFTGINTLSQHSCLLHLWERRCWMNVRVCVCVPILLLSSVPHSVYCVNECVPVHELICSMQQGRWVNLDTMKWWMSWAALWRFGSVVVSDQWCFACEGSAVLGSFVLLLHYSVVV